MTTSIVRRRADALRDFLDAETAGAVLLCVATTVALIWANSPWGDAYRHLLHAVPAAGPVAPGLDVHGWINDGAMALFFLIVGLEIRREVTTGELASVRRAALPALAALGGMVVPAVLYLAAAGGTSAGHGWGVPMATDIALAVGALTAAGSRVPSGAKVFLLALAIVDDLGAIVVIAVVYSGGIRWGDLAIAVAAVVGVFVVGRATSSSGAATGAPSGTGSSRVGTVLMVAGAVVAWWFTHRSGVHATLAGVALAAALPPARTETVEHRLHPWTSRLIVPLFALANAGLVVSATVLRDAGGSSLALAVVVGLVVGKPLGITAAVALGRRFGLQLPDGVTLGMVAALGVLAGTGFTVALFVSELAFAGRPADAEIAKLSILVASTVAAAGGLAAVVATTRRVPAPR